MVLPPSFSRKMGEIETVEAEKMGWIYLPRGTFYPTLPYVIRMLTSVDIVGHLGERVWILGRFICFFPSLI